MKVRAARARRLLVPLGSLALLVPLLPPQSPAAASLRLPTAAPAVAGFDGNPATTERINEGNPIFAAVDISKLRFPDGGAAHVVLARADTFADSVAGSGLTGDGPLLFTATGALTPVTAREVERVLDPGDTVYVLGGTAAVSDGVASTLRDRGYAVTRLAGPSRIETAIAVADEVRRLHPGDGLLLARSTGWADSIAGGAVAAATDTPLLITPTASLAPAVAAWIAKDAPAHTTLLGGTAALSTAVRDAVPDPTRLSGVDRTATAVAIARELHPDATRYVVAQGLADDGWSFGFASAGLAADAHAPILLVTNEVTDATADVVRTCGAPATDLQVVGDGSVVPAALREQLDAADGDACGPGGAVVYPTDLTGFPECADVLAAFKESALERVGPYGLDGYGVVMPGVAEGDSTPPPAADNSGGGGTPTSSPTNNQEDGVDEPDVVKTTDSTAYVVQNGSTLEVVRLNGGHPSVVATVALPPDGSSELLLAGNRLLAVTRTWGVLAGDPMPVDGIGIRPGPASTILTAIDVADAAHPVVESTMTIEGDYRSARMVGGVARLVLQTDPSAFELTYPVDSTPEALQAAAAANRAVIEASTLDDWLPAMTRADGTSSPLLDCTAVRRPPLFSGLGVLSVVTVDLAGSLAPTSATGVLASGDSVYASTSRLFVTTSRWDWSSDALGSVVTTEIHGFDISDPSVTRYVGSGAVPGYTIGQYALSELNGSLRIATTLQPPWDDAPSTDGIESGIHVLAEQGNGYVEVGNVGGLGRGERIYGVRYFGDVAAVVTFRQVDPLYLVDLADPTAPRVTGELKVTGFSSYLHRLSDGRLLGIGAEANDEGRITGSQVSLFDISNRASPTLVERLTFPDSYTQVQYDPHAFLWWPPTGLAVVPMDEYDANGPGFAGAVGIAAGDSGLMEVGRATHADDAGDAWPSITRSFVAGGVLYTVSARGIEADDLATLHERAFTRL